MLESVANELGCTPALAVALSHEHLTRLDEASAPVTSYPASLFTPLVKGFVFGGADVQEYGAHS